MPINASEIREHMHVVGADGEKVGTVDRVEGDRIKLTRSDSASGEHHYIAMDEVDHVEDGEVCLSATADDVKSRLN